MSMIRWPISCCLLAGLIALPVALTPSVDPVQAQPAAAPLTTDLAMVPGNAAGVIHVRLREMWHQDSLKQFRKVIERAGPKSLSRLDQDFTPAPSTIDRVTMIMLPFKDNPEPQFVTILTFTEPFVEGKVLKQSLPKATELKLKEKTLHVDPDSNIGVHFPDNKTIVLGEVSNIAELLGIAGKPGDMKKMLASSTSRPLTVVLNLKEYPIKKDLVEDLPADLKPLLTASNLILTADMKQQVTLHLEVGFGSEEDAKAGHGALKKGIELARSGLLKPRLEAQKLIEGRKSDTPRPLTDLAEAIGGISMLGSINTFDDYLAELPIEQKGATLSTSVALPEWTTQYFATSIVSVGLLLPAVQKVREAAARMSSSNNLKQMILAIMNYESSYGVLPPAAITDKNGKQLLSWRVAILPFIEQNALYQKFKLDEPWDSENNKKWSQMVVKTYVDPRAPGGDQTKTYYKLFVGKETPFGWVKSKKLTEITDGISNTIAIVAAGEPVEWAKPDDFEFDSKKKLPDLSRPFNQILAAFCDGHVATIDPNRKDFEKLMKAMITAAGGEQFNANE